MKSIVIIAVKKFKMDKCNNCGTTETKTFWDFKDKTMLCDNCHGKYGKIWQKEIDDHNLQESQSSSQKANFCGECGVKLMGHEKHCPECGKKI